MGAVIITDVMKMGILWLLPNVFSKNSDQCFSIVIISESGKNLSTLRLEKGYEISRAVSSILKLPVKIFPALTGKSGAQRLIA